MHTNYDLRPLHRLAVTVSVDIVADVTRADLASPTPCAGWDLRDLLTHMTVQHNGFAAAARGSGADLAVWDPATVADAVRADPLAPTPRRPPTCSGVLRRRRAGCDVRAARVRPGRRHSGMDGDSLPLRRLRHARLGRRPQRRCAVRAAGRGDRGCRSAGVGGSGRRHPRGGQFAVRPRRHWGRGASDLDRVLRHLGRSPDWRPEGVTVGR